MFDISSLKVREYSTVKSASFFIGSTKCTKNLDLEVLDDAEQDENIKSEI